MRDREKKRKLNKKNEATPIIAGSQKLLYGHPSMPPKAQIPLRRRQENDSRRVNREYSFRLFVLPLLNIKRHSNHR